MNVITQLKETAASVFCTVLSASKADTAPFKTELTVLVNGEVKPLLIVGTAFGIVEDGNCTAVLNPDPGLRDQLLRQPRALTSLHHHVAKRCDAAITTWIDAYKNNRVVVGGRYLAKQFKPAKYSV